MLKKPNERLKPQRAGGDEGVVLYSKGEILHKIRGLSQKKQGLVAFLYLTGCRISEAIGNKSTKYPTQPIKRYQIEVKKHKGNDMLIVNNVPVLKRKGYILRNIPIVIEKEREFVEILLKYLETLQPNDALFPMTRQTAWKIVYDIGLWCHYFRHLRNTHLTIDYGLSGQELRALNGWSSSRPADVYVHLNWRNIAEKIMHS